MRLGGEEWLEDALGVLETRSSVADLDPDRIQALAA
jgi:hypothetical protein